MAIPYAHAEAKSWQPVVRMMSTFVVAENVMALTNTAWEFERSWQQAQSAFFFHFNVAIVLEIVAGVFAAGLLVGGLLTLRGRMNGCTCILIFVPLQLCAGLVRTGYFYLEVVSTSRAIGRNSMIVQSIISLAWMFVTPGLIWLFFRRPEVRQVLTDAS